MLWVPAYTILSSSIGKNYLNVAEVFCSIWINDIWNYNILFPCRRPRIDRSQIGQPMNFRHTGHVGSSDLGYVSRILFIHIGIMNIFNKPTVFNTFYPVIAMTICRIWTPESWLMKQVLLFLNLSASPPNIGVLLLSCSVKITLHWLWIRPLPLVSWTGFSEARILIWLNFVQQKGVNLQFKEKMIENNKWKTCLREILF